MEIFRSISIGFTALLILQVIDLWSGASAQAESIIETFEAPPYKIAVSDRAVQSSPEFFPTSGSHFYVSSAVIPTFGITQYLRDSIIVRAGFNRVKASHSLGTCRVQVRLGTGERGFEFVDSPSLDGQRFEFAAPSLIQEIDQLSVMTDGADRCYPALDDIFFETVPRGNLNLRRVDIVQGDRINPDFNGDGRLDLVRGEPAEAILEIVHETPPVPGVHVWVELTDAVGWTVRRSYSSISETATIRIPIDTNIKRGFRDLVVTIGTEGANAYVERMPWDNLSIVPIDLKDPYRLEVIVLSGDKLDERMTTVRIGPSMKQAAGCKAGEDLKRARLKINCVHEESGFRASGCSYSARLVLGDDNGGHDHGPRPEFALGELEGSIPGQMIEVPFLGDTLTYVAPEAAGEFLLKLDLMTPQGKVIPQDDVVLRVKIGERLVPLDWEELYAVVNSHPRGNYVNNETYDGLADAILQYSTDADEIPGVIDATPIPMTGASLPWGGVFDIHHTYHAPQHCGHRGGDTIDVDHRKLNTAERVYLNQAFIQNGFQYKYPPHSPDAAEAPNHWHVTWVGNKEE